MKFAQKKDSAVSPVIGTILLVAITVILVAIIAAVVMPMVGGTTGAATIGVQVVPNGTEVDVTFTGGDYAKITALKLADSDATFKKGTDDIKYPVSLGATYTSSSAGFNGLEDVKLIAVINGNEQIIWQGKLTFNS